MPDKRLILPCLLLVVGTLALPLRGRAGNAPELEALQPQGRAASSSQFLPSETKPLREAVRTAFENSPGLRADFDEYLAALEKVPQVGALPDPTVAFAPFLTPTETRVGPVRARLSLAQRVPWFGLLHAREDVASRRAEALRARFEESKARLARDVRVAWAELFARHRAVEATRENLEILGTFQRLALIKLEAGRATAVDELRVEIERANLIAELARLEDQVRTFEVTFNTLLGVPTGNEVRIPGTLPEVTDPEADVADLFERLLVTNPSLRRLAQEEEVWALDEDVARREGRPDFEVGLDYSIVGSARSPLPDGSSGGDDTIVFPRIAVSIPVSRRKVRARITEAELRRSAARARRSQRELQLRAELEKHLDALRDATRRIDVSRKQKDLGNQALDLLLADYSTDGSNFEEVLRMERRVLDYDLALERARADQSQAVAELEHLLGGPLARSSALPAAAPPSEDAAPSSTSSTGAF